MDVKEIRKKKTKKKINCIIIFNIIVPIIRLIHHDNDERSPESLGEKLISLDQKVSDIDHKLVNLKNQLDNNFLQNDDINAEASEKKPVSMSVVEITKAMSNEVMNHVSIEIENLRQATGALDRKLQFHINLVSDNLGAIYNLMTDVHDAVVDKAIVNDHRNSTTTTQPPPKQSKFDRLVERMHPMLTVSEKMDEVWNVVVSSTIVSFFLFLFTFFFFLSNLSDFNNRHKRYFISFYFSIFNRIYLIINNR